MNVPESIANLAGDWTGANQLWVVPGEPVRQSDTNLTVTLAERGGFAMLRYTWAEGGEAQEGLLALGPVLDQNAIDAVWMDTWHMATNFMAFNGVVDEDGNVTLNGSYAAPEGPDWGWQIRITPRASDTFLLTMFNITPEGEVYPAVEAAYSRR